MNRLGRKGGHSHFSLFLCTIGMLLALVCSLITISVTIDFWAPYIVIDKYYCADTSLLNDPFISCPNCTNTPLSRCDEIHFLV